MRERILSVAIALTLLIVIGLVLNLSLGLAQSNKPMGLAPDGPAIGSKMPLKGKNPALLFLMSTDCAACNDTVAFLKDAVKESRKAKNYQVIVLVPNGQAEVGAFITKHGFKKADAPLFISARKVVGAFAPSVPLVVLINANGIVQASWKGKPTAAAELDIKNKAKALK